MTIPTPTRSVSKRVSDLLAQMTLDEKLAQIGSYYVYDLKTKGELDPQKIEDKLKHGIGQITRIGGGSTLDPQSAAKVANTIQTFLVENTRLGIPALVHEECCSGAMLLGGTMFPQMLGLAATFQPDLAEQMTTVIRKQLRAMGAHQGLAPVLDVSRDPRWGRVEETFGEDPTLVSHFGMAYVRGLQADDLTEGIIATGKHFVGHSLSQGGLNCGPVHVGPRELWDIFLMPFHAAIRDTKLASIMNAYPELDGEVVAASRRILTDLLRGQLGFDGIVVSDYHAINMIHDYHRMAPDKATAASRALHAGIDVELPTSDYYAGPLRAALEAGEINVELVDTAVQRHLQKKFELGLFENPYVDEDSVYEVFETMEQRSLARELAQKSMVLLKNDGLLPLNKSIGTLAVIGPNADDGRNQLGDYSYAAMSSLMQYSQPENSSFIDSDPAHIAEHDIKVITALDGIREAVSSDTKVFYAKGCDNLDDDRSGFDEALQIAEQADVVVLVLGDRAGLTPSCTVGETRDSVDLRLPGVQEELAKAVLAMGKPVVAVLVNGRPYAIPWLDENANAILEAWLPGEEGGRAIADVLFGNVNPGGKLPITFPRHVGQVPVFYNYKPSGMRSNWYVDYVTEKVTPLYSFGHGLSYTSFEYKDLCIGKAEATAGETVDVSVNVTNTGPVAGDEVVQLYSRDEYASTPRPVKELKGYARITLQPGETRTVIFHLPVDQLAFYDENLSLVLERGKIELMLGSSSEDIRLRGEIEIIGEKKIPVQERVFVCPVSSR
ncbi:MAG TPA: glycoside hydrolase family 3 N-terminal domain-containing protein [Anaerolineales bacterium]|nr:glycoside hydrolase family 3 N-terminal domain-containing protein [Anaerolineales bacterium]